MLLYSPPLAFRVLVHYSVRTEAVVLSHDMGWRLGIAKSRGFLIHYSSITAFRLVTLCGGKYSNNRMAETSAVVNEDKPKCSTCGHRNKRKRLLTFRRPQARRDLQQDPLASTANP